MPKALNPVLDTDVSSTAGTAGVDDGPACVEEVDAIERSTLRGVAVVVVEVEVVVVLGNVLKDPSMHSNVRDLDSDCTIRVSKKKVFLDLEIREGRKNKQPFSWIPTIV